MAQLELAWNRFYDLLSQRLVTGAPRRNQAADDHIEAWEKHKLQEDQALAEAEELETLPSISTESEDDWEH